jgi:hypothetical protein
MERFINGFLDLITIWFLSDLEKTNAFIWCNGIANVHHWFLLAGYIGVSKLYHMFMNMRYSLVTNNPWFFIALTTMVIGTQLFLAFLAKSFYEQRATKNVIISSEVNL